MNEKKYFLSIVLLTIIIFIYSGYIAINQNTEYTDDGLIYINTQELILKEPEKAISNLDYLQTKDPNNYIFHLDKAKAYLNLEDSKNAEVECKKSLEQRPVLDEDKKFMSIYGQVLYLNKNYEEAKSVLIQAKKLGIPDEYKDDINMILKELQ